MLYKTCVKFSAKTIIKSHPFYIVKPSAYAIFVSIFAGLTAKELVEYFHTGNTYQLYVGFFGFIGTILLWFGSIMKESNNPDIYTVSVRENYIFGVLLFIISEVMIFFAFFWTYLHSSLNPTFAIGSIWPPYNLFPMNTFRWPFFNTTLLLLSGVTVNVFYYTLKSQNIFKINKFDFKYMQSFFNQKIAEQNNNFSFCYEDKFPSFLINRVHFSSVKEINFYFKIFSNLTKKSKNFNYKVFVSTFIYEFLEWRLKLMYTSLIYTIFFGLLFVYCQYYEYMHASFDITDGIYGSIFYTLTGLHGAHVIIGVILLIIVFFRLVFKQYNFTFSPHVGVTAAVWYWHFVDLIWVFVYFIVYLWGNSLLNLKLKMKFFFFYFSPVVYFQSIYSYNETSIWSYFFTEKYWLFFFVSGWIFFFFSLFFWINFSIKFKNFEKKSFFIFFSVKENFFRYSIKIKDFFYKNKQINFFSFTNFIKKKYTFIFFFFKFYIYFIVSSFFCFYGIIYFFSYKNFFFFDNKQYFDINKMIYVNFFNISTSFFFLILLFFFFSYYLYKLFFDFFKNKQVSKNFNIYFVPFIFIAHLSLTFLLFTSNFIFIYMCIELFSVIIYYLISVESVDFKKKFYVEKFYNTDLSLRYFIISLFGSINILLGIAFIFFFYGSFDNKIISLYFIPNSEGLQYICGTYSNFGFIIFIIGFCIKFGIAPYHFWINGIYDRFKTFFFQYIIIFPKSVFLCFIINFFSNFYSGYQIDNKFFSVFFIFTFLGMLNIFFGTFSAFIQTDLKRLIMYSSLTNVGYVFLCIGSNVENSFFIAYSYIIHYTLALFVLFRVINEIEVKINKKLFQWNFSEFSIISFKHKVFITFSFFNLAGLPPFPLFFNKFFIFSHFWLNEFFFVFFFMSFFSIIGYAYYFNFIRFIWFNEKFSYFSVFSKISFYEEKSFYFSNFYFSKVVDIKNFFFWILREGKFSNFYWNFKFNFEEYFFFKNKNNTFFFNYFYLLSNYNFFFFTKFKSFIEKFEKIITRLFFYFFFIGFFSVSYCIIFFKKIFISYFINKYFFGKKIISFFFISGWNENINFYFIEKKKTNQAYYSKNIIFEQLTFFDEKFFNISNIIFENNITFWFKKNYPNSISNLSYFFFKKLDDFFLINHYKYISYNPTIHDFYKYQIYENSLIFIKLFIFIVIFFIFFFLRFFILSNYGVFSFFIFSNVVNRYFVCSIYFIGLIILNFFKIFSFFKFFINNKNFNIFISWIEYNIIIFSFFIWFFFIYFFFNFFTDLIIIRYLLGFFIFFFIFFSYPKKNFDWFNFSIFEKKNSIQNSSINFKLKIYNAYKNRKGFFWKKYSN